MKKLKNKIWKDRHARTKGLKEAYRRKRYGYFQISPVGNKYYTIEESKKQQHYAQKRQRKLDKNVFRGRRKEMIAPRNFSLYQNPDETLEYIENIKDEVMKSMPVHIEMKSIEELSIDTIMYFLAILKRLKLSGIGYSCGGTLPANERCKYLLRSSGFLSYVSSRDIDADLTRETDIVRIICGQYTEPRIAKNICDFVISKLNITRIDTMNLYTMIMELMSNTRNHAYINTYHMITDWYIYVHYLRDNNSIRFIFLDTGDGIPSTIRKSLLEPIKKSFGLISHTDYIRSALEGIVVRSRSGEPHRGNGLPTINSFYIQRYIKDLTIISNNGYYGEDRQDDLDFRLEGTLFYWEISQGHKNESN